MLKTHRAGKGPGGCRGWGLGSRNRRAPGVSPTPGLRGQGTSSGSPAGFLGMNGWGKHPPLLLLLSGRALPTCPSCSPWPQGRPSCLASTSLPPAVPLHPTGSLWGSSRLLGCQSPPLVSGRCPSCAGTLTPLLPTLPS